MSAGTPTLDADLRAKYDALFARLEGAESLVVGFSGGVDSTLLTRVAHDALGARCVALTTISPTLPPEELDEAHELASFIGVEHRAVELDELTLPGFTRNALDRCAICKGGLTDVLLAEALRLGFDHVAIGSNADDLSDFRPGHHAAVGKGSLAPMVDVGLSKNEVRRMARQLGLPNWDKPAAACLASRVPFGTEITATMLNQIWQLEHGIKALGFRVVRARHHGELARIELGSDEVARAMEPGLRAAIVGLGEKAGFRFVTLDMRGYRQGSLNQSGEAASS